MVTDNGHWNYCIIILRRKGRKRWETTEAEDMCTCSTDEENLRYYHFSFGPRLLCPVSQQPRNRHTGNRGIRSRISKYRSLNLKYLHWFFVVLLYLNCLSPASVLAATKTTAPSEHPSSSNGGKEICSSIDIRNSVNSFNQLNDCRVIEGFLQIVLMDRTNESDFANLQFPKLREITGYLLLYRVNGLRTLANLFPNLSVIRGHDLFINYALAVYEMLHLQELGLHSLTDIARGYVFITKNPLLCYIDTIDWNRIVSAGKDNNLIFDNRQSNACPKCPNFSNPVCGYNNQTKQFNCWNAKHCQKICPGCSTGRCSDTGECCDGQCLGGCDKPGSDHCVACKHVVLPNDNRCMTKCPDSYFSFKDRRCISEAECYNMPRPKEQTSSQIGDKPYKPFNGTCIIECPFGYQEVAVARGGEKLLKCEQCSGACRKICEAANVDSIQSAQRLKGCVIINGSLEIQLRGGGNIVKELEDSLNMIEEITGYLKIVRSQSLVSLNFLRRLKVIKGTTLENSKYALVVLDNQNLAELWDFSRRENDLRIETGKIFFHFNPKLCLDKITALQKRLKIENVTDLDIAPSSNGDKVACNITTLSVAVSTLQSESCLLSWIPYNHYELRTLLGYVVYYMEVPPNVNVSMNDGRDACGGDGWKSADVEAPDYSTINSTSRANVTHPITHLKPYTRYAYYVRTYTIASENNGAQSPIQYFTTLPSIPNPPRQVKVSAISSNAIKIEWQPPERANGELEKYVILIKEPKEGKSLTMRNYCNEPLDPERRENLYREESKKKYLYPVVDKNTGECNCPSTENLPKIKKNDQEVQALIEFENKLHDNIYVKKPQDTVYGKNNNSHRNSTEVVRSRRETRYPEHDTSLRNASFIERFAKENESIDFPKNNENESANIPEIPRYEVDHTILEKEITNLKHFTEYSVHIQACRKLLPSEPSNSSTSLYCSVDKIENVQTLPLADADRINESTIEVNVLNDTTNSVELKWEEPQLTNGQILTYVIQFKRVDIDNQAQSQCIPRFEFLQKDKRWPIKGLNPGNYSVRIRATSLAKDNEHFTEARTFVIKETEVPVLRQLLLGALFAVLLIIVILIVLLVGVRYFYPDSWYHRKRLFATVNPEYFKPLEGYDKWEISKKKIAFDNLLGIGHFGEVYEGRAKGIIQKGVTTKVAIKTLNKSPTNHHTWMSFLNEASVMKQFDTHHVVRLLGVVTKGQPLVIMELMAKGDLRTYLRSCRADVPEEERKGPLQAPPTLKEILQMAAEIADGMLYLSDKKFVHRDLAARNCMINTEGTVKIGDFGLTRDVYETDYYRKDSKGHLPVRWMAPESLRDGIFTSRSDVWSYGVVLWEMVTLASLPYTGLGNGEVMPYVINGGVMEEPENCPTILSEIMKQCWQYKYIQRPTFSEILEILLPNIRDDFAQVSYYHTEEAKQLRASNAEAVADEDTPYTPLRIKEDFEDFSLDSDDNDEENGVENVDLRTSNEANTSSGNASLRSLPTVNGYIRRPHNLLPLVSTKTTPC